MFPTTNAQHIPIDTTHTLYSENLNNLTDLHQTTPAWLSKPTLASAAAALHLLMQMTLNPEIAVSRSRHPSAMVPRLVPAQFPPLPVFATETRPSAPARNPHHSFLSIDLQDCDHVSSILDLVVNPGYSLASNTTKLHDIRACNGRLSLSYMLARQSLSAYEAM